MISGMTRLLALIGDPVAQARSPGLVNALLERHGLADRFVLVPLQVPPEGLMPVVSGLRHLHNFAGAIITMPHKVAAASLVDRLSGEAEQVGAINVVRREASGELIGAMLDGEGFVRGLAGAGHRVSGKRCLLLGAGGAAAAIAFALARHGCATLVISNRTAARADALASNIRHCFPGVAVSSATNPAGPFDLLINATSLGMQADDPLPVEEALIERSSVVADCVVSRKTTRLLEIAQRHGRVPHGGKHMLAAQLELMMAFMGIRLEGSGINDVPGGRH